MAAANETEPLTIGTLVRIRHSGHGVGRIAEYRGPLGPKGARVYGVWTSLDPDPGYTEVREDQLEIVACPAPPCLSEPLPPGTKVRIRDARHGVSVVAEYLGQFGPKGARAYGLWTTLDPDAGYTVALEENLEVLQTPCDAS